MKIKNKGVFMQDFSQVPQEQPKKKKSGFKIVFYFILLIIIGVLYINLWEEYSFVFKKRTVTQEERDMYKKAYDLFQNKDYSTAKQQCQQLISKFPRNANCYDILSIIEFLDKNYKLAEVYAGKAIKNTSIPSYYYFYHRGQAREKLGKDYAAAKDFKKAGKITPSLNDGFLRAGHIYKEDTHDLFDAIKCYKKHLEYHPDSNAAVYNAAYIYKNDLFSIKKALDLLSNFIAKNKKVEDYVYELRGDIYREEKEYQKAIADYTKAIELNPKNGSYYNELAWCYRDSNQPQKAIESFNKAEEVEPGFGYAYSNLGDLYQRLKQPENAVAAYQKALEIRPDNYDVYGFRYPSYMELNNFVQAKADIEEYSKHRKLSSLDVYNLGVCYYFMKDFTSAKREYVKAIDLDNNNSWAHLESGIMSLFFCDINEASKEIITFFELGEKDSDKLNMAPFFARGYEEVHFKINGTKEQFEDANFWYYDDYNDTDKTIKHLEKMIERHPADPYYYFMLGITQDRAGISSKETYAKAEEIDAEALKDIRKNYLTSIFNRSSIGKEKLHKLQQKYPDNTIWYFFELDSTADLTQAVEIAKQILKINPFMLGTYSKLSRKYYIAGQYDKALSLITQAIDLNPDFSSAYLQRALINARLGNQAASKEDYIQFRTLRNKILYDGKLPVITN